MKTVRIVGKVLLWIVTILAGLAMAAAGQGKFVNPDVWSPWFESWGYPGWFMMFVGGAEVVGGLSLLIPKAAPYGAAGLIIIMLGALFTVVTKESGPFNALPVVIYLVLLSLILWIRRPRWMKTTVPPDA